MFSVVGEVEVAICSHIIALMWVLSVRIEDVTITTYILLIQPKIYLKSVIKKLTDYLSLDNQKKSVAIFCSADLEIG